MARRVICNKCGKSMDMLDIQQKFNLRGVLCYGSKYDGQKYELDLCCTCMDDLMESCRIAPIDMQAFD